MDNTIKLKIWSGVVPANKCGGERVPEDTEPMIKYLNLGDKLVITLTLSSGIVVVNEIEYMEP